MENIFVGAGKIDLQDDDILQKIEKKVRTKTYKLLNQYIEFNNCLINRFKLY